MTGRSGRSGRSILATRSIFCAFSGRSPLAIFSALSGRPPLPICSDLSGRPPWLMLSVSVAISGRLERMPLMT
ncbi:hypothetical protein AWR36_004150 [Microbulbifer flavimaris]|uniref:Uncharacterized protein n=1 Tax=Microbulbifer flavimaris TaxID=1781068 RepID=A0ABX4I3E1_9GAMM|nr:hypothetical protein AWR36_004150 [Microbulbifer flavimaris]